MKRRKHNKCRYLWLKVHGQKKIQQWKRWGWVTKNKAPFVCACVCICVSDWTNIFPNLECFAETHVISQDAAGTRLVQFPEPGDTLLLVVVKFPAKRLGNAKTRWNLHHSRVWRRRRFRVYTNRKVTRPLNQSANFIVVFTIVRVTLNFIVFWLRDERAMQMQLLNMLIE